MMIGFLSAFYEIAIWANAFIALAFVIVYSRYDWRSNIYGQNFMHVTAMLALMFIFTGVSRLIASASVPIAYVIADAMLVGMAIVLARRLALLRQHPTQKESTMLEPEEMEPVDEDQLNERLRGVYAAASPADRGEADNDGEV